MPPIPSRLLLQVERRFCKPDVFAQLGVPVESEIGSSRQRRATALVFCKHPQSMRLVPQWHTARRPPLRSLNARGALRSPPKPVPRHTNAHAARACLHSHLAPSPLGMGVQPLVLQVG